MRLGKSNLEILNDSLSINRNITKYVKNRRSYDETFRLKMNKTTREYIRKHRQDKRIELMMILGGVKCSNPKCLVSGGCKDIRCLQFDHVKGGGLKQYKAMGGTARIINYYINHIEEAKRDLQVLCANCNWIKRSENKEYNNTYITS